MALKLTEPLREGLRQAIDVERRKRLGFAVPQSLEDINPRYRHVFEQMTPGITYTTRQLAEKLGMAGHVVREALHVCQSARLVRRLGLDRREYVWERLT